VTPRAWAAFAAVSVLWGIPYLFIKVAVEEVSPGFVAWARVALGAAILLPLAWRIGALRGVRDHLGAVALFGLVEISLPFFLIAFGEQHIASSLAAILIAAVPLAVALLSVRYVPADKPTGSRLVGLVVGLAGVVALMGIDVAGRPLELLGAACVLVATLGYAGGPIIARSRLAHLHPMGPVAAGLVVSTVALAPFAVLGRPERVPSGDVVLSLVVLGVLSTAAGLAVFFFLVSEAGPSRAAVVTYVNPTIAVALGVTLLGERLGVMAVAGLLLILAGSWLSTGGRLPPGLASALRPLAALHRSRRPPGEERLRPIAR
jgi:drug/metabolite transporter (DMT)-like permease